MEQVKKISSDQMLLPCEYTKKGIKIVNIELSVIDTLFLAMLFPPVPH